MGGGGLGVCGVGQPRKIEYLRAAFWPHRPRHRKEYATIPAAGADEDQDECERKPEPSIGAKHTKLCREWVVVVVDLGVAVYGSHPK